MRHHFGGEQFHAAHNLHMRNHSADVEPADYTPDVELWVGMEPRPIPNSTRPLLSTSKVAISSATHFSVKAPPGSLRELVKGTKGGLSACT